jgi:hypothetical protein
MEELYDKFRDLAGMALSKEKVDRLLESLIHVEKIDKIGALTALAVM